MLNLKETIEKFLAANGNEWETQAMKSAERVQGQVNKVSEQLNQLATHIPEISVKLAQATTMINQLATGLANVQANAPNASMPIVSNNSKPQMR